MICYMCKKAKAKPLTAKEGDRIYVNAQNVKLFCSVRCAANYALLWFDYSCNHWCQYSNQWEMCEEYVCKKCRK